MLKPHSSRPVWSFSSQNTTKDQPRYPTTPGDRVEGAIVYIISKREEFTSKESPRGVLQRKQTPAEMKQKSPHPFLPLDSLRKVNSLTIMNPNGQ